MPFLQFLGGGIDRSLAMGGSHDPALVLLSYLAAALAAYAALSIADRLIAAETPLGRKSWLAAGAL
ncbi:MAG: hypothetical protein HYU38_06165, partial [Candidatus Tectomicrobia bacterium]|nr:hypothetical protein [Candidatus Tectomicrobia bacterium]